MKYNPRKAKFRAKAKAKVERSEIPIISSGATSREEIK